MHTRIRILAALSGVGALSACTSGQSAIVPPSTSVNVTAVSKLQFAVGTANINGTPGLNTVETFRQTNGLSATLLNTPKITGPGGFVVPSDPNVSGNVDAGTNTITGSPQVASGASATPTTFGVAGGAFAYGFAPINSDVSGAATFASYGLPFYVPAAQQLTYVLGPGNAYVGNFRDGTLGGFPGYPSGFTDFALAPIAGSYTLTVNVPTSGGVTIAPFIATAKLASTALLPPFGAPTFVSDGAGGGSVTVTVPSGCTEALVYVVDTGTATSPAATSYTFETKTTGTQTIAIPDAIGPITAGVAGPTLTSGDTIAVYAVGFDYAAIEAAPVGKTPPQTPPIAGPNGQADITTSATTTATE